MDVGAATIASAGAAVGIGIWLLLILKMEASSTLRSPRNWKFSFKALSIYSRVHS